jgi:hypothetical protein
MTKIGVCCRSSLCPALAGLLWLWPGLTATSAVETPKEIRFHGIRATGPEGLVGLRNPERGFRIGTVFAELEGSTFLRAARQFELDLETVKNVYADFT